MVARFQGQVLPVREMLESTEKLIHVSQGNEFSFVTFP